VSEPHTGSARTAVLEAIASALVGARDELNRLDGAAGDGDLGLTAGRAAEALREIAPAIADQEPAAAARTVGMALARKAPSTGGTLIAFACLAAGRVDLAGQAPGQPTLAMLLEAARDEVAARGKVAVGDRTMLDALAPAVDVMRAAADRGESIADALAAAARAADAGAAGTTDLAATTGRAGWLAERARGHEDAGARLVAIVFAAAAEAAAATGS
jgi:phosphoenolpyruvate---glycerone phosphotransferase subunit DhaL